MGLWIAQPTLLHGEHVEHECLGNLFRGLRQVGVRVTVTDQRVIVMPNHLDRLLRATPLDIARPSIIGVSVEPPDTSRARQRGLSARVRPQVQIQTPHGEWSLTVRDPDALLGAIGTRPA